MQCPVLKAVKWQTEVCFSFKRGSYPNEILDYEITIFGFVCHPSSQFELFNHSGQQKDSYFVSIIKITFHCL